jgi:uncharacterized membrane protein YdbT with pleckstrin-like domain
MPENKPQTYANHARLDPGFHFVLAPLSLIAIILSIVSMFYPGLRGWLGILLAVTLFLAVGMLRSYALKVQDRVIRLEERMRLNRLLPERDRPRIQELSESQLIALRFASDEELPALAMRALQENLTKKQIKMAIQTWRPDTFRV